MKRARIMLTAIVIFAVVGGALAFKAKTTSVGFAHLTCAPVGATALKSAPQEVVL